MLKITYSIKHKGAEVEKVGQLWPARHLISYDALVCSEVVLSKCIICVYDISVYSMVLMMQGVCVYGKRTSSNLLCIVAVSPVTRSFKYQHTFLHYKLAVSY